MSSVHPVNMPLCLAKICESNFEQLFRLIPHLCSFQKSATGKAINKTALHVQILERSKYTLTIELNYCFGNTSSELILPAIKIRVYLDAKQVEVIKHHAKKRVSSVYKSPAQSVEILHYKWRLNYFLQKWLNHCLLTPYQFKSNSH